MTDKTPEQIEYEIRLRKRLTLLKEQLEAGKVKIAEGLQVAESLKNVRYGEDGEIDLDSVDGFVRSMALGIEGMHTRQELKKVASLIEIQNAYFNFLDINFSKYYKIMKKEKVTPHDVGMLFSSSESNIKEVKTYMYKTLDYIDEFWAEVGDIAQIHVEDMNNNLKGVFGGDLFPNHEENIASKCSLYTDTIILPDPFLRSKHIFKTFDDSQKVYYFIKHAMNLLQYKDLACADLDIPIVVVLPDYSVLDNSEKDYYSKLAEEDSLSHNAKMFGRSFDSFEDFMEFASKLDTIEKAISEMSDTSRVLFDTEWGNDPLTQITKMKDSSAFKSTGISHPGEIIANMSFGRMATSNELLVKASRVRGVPIIDAPTSWEYFKWKLEYDSKNVENLTNVTDLHMTKALQSLSGNDMQWIGNIPVESLIEIRKENAMDEIRSILTKDISNLIDMNPTNFHRSHDQVFDNITEAFRKHQENINDLKNKKWSFYGKDIGSMLVTGSLEITAALTGTPLFGLLKLGMDQVTDTPKLKDIPQTIKDLKEENDKVQKSPVGMFFNIKKESV